MLQARTLSRRLLLVVTCLFMLGGCATKLAYNFLDWATLWYIESYVNLDGKQKDYAREQLDKFHYWHRTTQLPQYALYLEGLQVKLNSGKLTGEMIHAETDQVQVFLDDCLKYLTPMFVELVATFSDDQVDELMASLAKERKQYQEDFVDVEGEKLHEARIDELTSQLSLVVSGFNKSQKARMHAWSESLIPFEKLTLKQQEIWAEDLHQAMLKREDRPALEATLRRLLFVHTDNWDPELEKRMDTNQALSYDMLADLFNSLTPPQRKKMNKKLTGFIVDFRELAMAASEEAP